LYQIYKELAVIQEIKAKRVRWLRQLSEQRNSTLAENSQSRWLQQGRTTPRKIDGWIVLKQTVKEVE